MSVSSTLETMVEFAVQLRCRNVCVSCLVNAPSQLVASLRSSSSSHVLTSEILVVGLQVERGHILRAALKLCS